MLPFLCVLFFFFYDSPLIKTGNVLILLDWQKDILPHIICWHRCFYYNHISSPSTINNILTFLKPSFYSNHVPFEWLKVCHSCIKKCLQLLLCVHNTCLFLLWHLSLFLPDPLTPCPFDRSPINEEAAPLGEGPSDDDIVANTSSSDEEDEGDSSSVSSKGDPEQPEESTVRRADAVYNLWL